jgi:hypothetical protein
MKGGQKLVAAVASLGAWAKFCQRHEARETLYFLAAAGLPAAAGLAAGEPVGLAGAAGLAQAAEGEDSPCIEQNKKKSGWSNID